MFRNHALRIGRVFLMLGLILLAFPLSVFAQAPSSLTGTGYGVGDTAFDFTGPDQDMNPVSLYQFYGRYTVLAYDSVWCPASNVNAKELNTAVTDFSALGLPLQAVTVLIDGNTPGLASIQLIAQKWFKRYHDAPVIHMNGTYDPNIIQQFLAYSTPNGGDPNGAYPTIVILNPNFQIVYVKAGVLETGQYENLIWNDLSANLTQLKSMVQAMNLKGGLTSSLSAKVDDASAALSRHAVKQVHNALTDFRTLVNNQTGKGLTSEQANTLNNQASLINAGIGY